MFVPASFEQMGRRCRQPGLRVQTMSVHQVQHESPAEPSICNST